MLFTEESFRGWSRCTGATQRPLAEEFILRSVGDQVTELQVFSKDMDTTVVVWGGRNSII